MSEQFPGVTVTTGSDMLGSVSKPTAFHIDDEIEHSIRPLYIYIWESERHERTEELQERIEELRNQYIFATGIVYAEPLRALVPLEPDQITAYAWLLRLCTAEELFKDTEEAARMIYQMQKELQ